MTQHTVDTLMAIADAYAESCMKREHILEHYAQTEFQIADAHKTTDGVKATLRTALTKALAQPVREPLTDKQISKLWSDAHNDTSDMMAFQVLAKMIERAHGIGGKK